MELELEMRGVVGCYMLDMCGCFGRKVWGENRQPSSNTGSIKFTPPDHLPLRACLYHPLYYLNLLRGSQRDRCIRETHNDGSLKFSSVLIIDKVAVSDVEGTSLV